MWEPALNNLGNHQGMCGWFPARVSEDTAGTTTAEGKEKAPLPVNATGVALRPLLILNWKAQVTHRA